jgi:error-prone DNA polymerase
MGLTDHQGFYGVVKFARAAKEAGLPALYGTELALGAAYPRDRVVDPDGDHLVVLAKNPQGYAALSSLVAKGHLRGGEKGRFQLTLDDLAAASQGNFLVLTGCRKGPLNRALLAEGPRAAQRELAHLVEVLGKECLVVECFDHGDPLDEARNEALSLLAVSRGVPAVATGNVHYATKAQARLGAVVAAVRCRSTLDEIDGHLRGAHGAHLRSPDEQAWRFRRFPGLVETSVELAAAYSFDLSLVSPNLPDFGAEHGISDMALLRRLVAERAPERYGTRSHPRVEGAYCQIDYELDIIEQLGFAGYFLVVYDIVEFCRREDIFCQGRGSAANSAVCYALGITNCDPVALALLFERFLSPERDGPPDIDVDIESGRREEVIQYVYRTYSRERAAQVANVISYRSRSAIRDVGRTFGYAPGLVDRWSKQVEGFHSLAHAEREDQRAPRHREVPAIPPEVLEFARQLEHSPRHLGLHPGGMVICDRPIAEVCPTEWSRTGTRTVLQWDKDDCAAIGLVKFDLLGLGMLSALHVCVDLVKEYFDHEVDLALIPQEDVVYDMLCAADSVGVFQVESRAQMATLPRLKPRHFYDLVVEVALIRPGPIQGGSVHPYIRRRNGLEAVTYLHPLLEPSLGKTLGVPLFQEQLMQMAIDVAGFSPAEADQLRQAMGSKRSVARMGRLRDRLFEGMAERGITGEIAEAIYDKLAAFANFGFPESHSASFAYLVYASAWFKYHYPAAFCAALIQSQPMGFWSPNTLVADARRHGVEVLPPIVNRSSGLTTLERSSDREVQGPAVRLGLDQVRGIGATLAQEIARSGPYETIDDLVRSVGMNEAQLMSLARAGALSELGGSVSFSRRQALWTVGALPRGGAQHLQGLRPHVAPPLPELHLSERYAMDLWSTGIIPDGHPMEILREELTEDAVASSSQLHVLSPGSLVRVAGVVTHRQRPHTAKGVTFINLEDEEGLMNVICTKVIWQRYREVARQSNALVVTGVLERYDGVINVLARRIEPLIAGAPLRSRDFR